ncbi:MAG: carboxylating nicotinate-nucleotide diphosphorylase [Candidatus Omnitrophica bacterium]|nr:carboxylating nicotinate-nucleotide diphosphorylase [Candidatus Omnitrophota bacterium]
MIRLKKDKIKELLRAALKEDVKTGDITSNLLIAKGQKVKANLILREDGVIAGLDIYKLFFRMTNKQIRFKSFREDGDFIKAGKGSNAKVIAEVSGNARDILKIERLGLNLIAHLSGIASLTYKFVKEVKGYKTKIIDTRKTTPNLRYFEKYAVRVGGGLNHRMGLYDKVLIKDNHIKISGMTPADCVRLAGKRTKKEIEVEIKHFSQLLETIKAKPDVIMLDNMNIAQIKKAIAIKDNFYKQNKSHKKILIEVSGNVSLSNVRKIAACKVDLISIGALTHSNPSLDMALKVV